MAEQPQTAAEAVKACRLCGESIKAAARKCIKCDSWQDWRAGLGVGTTALSLLVALVTVITAAAPVLKRAATPENSRMRFTV